MRTPVSTYHRLDHLYHEEPILISRIDSTSQPDCEIPDRETQGRTLSLSCPRLAGSSNPSTWKTRWSKPQQVAILWSLGVFVVVFVNLVLLGWALKVFATADLIVKLQQGDCAKANRINFWVHLVINLLGTVILGGSNYCMQCLVAPTRSQINKAHARQEWLDIGISSWRNLRLMSRKRQGVWWTLGLSSIPIHLLLNSAFFVSLSTNGYNVLVTTEAFLQNAPFDDSFLPTNGTSWDGWTPNCRLWHDSDVSWQQYVGRLRYDGKSYPLYAKYMAPFDPRDLQQTLTSGKTFEELDKRSCIKAYATDLLTDRRNLVLVSTNASSDGSSILYGGSSQYISMADPDPDEGIHYSPYAWICSDLRIQRRADDIEAYQNCFNYIEELVATSSTWSPWMFTVERCLSEKVPENCSFSLNLVILMIVLICDLIKLVCIWSFAFQDFVHPFLTLGDAIQSYLEEPDPAFECLRIAHDPGSVAGIGWETGTDGSEIFYAARQRVRRHDLATERQWNVFRVLSFLAIVSVCCFLVFAIASKPSQVSLWSLGLGKVNVSSLIHGWLMDKFNGTAYTTSAIIASVLVANVPQIVLSAIYLCLSNLCTSITCGEEWNRLNVNAEGLRVTSTPRGLQRTSYFLSLPYAISLPIMLSTALLHWLISQSIFLVVVAVYDPNGTLKNPIAVATCGFSAIGMICALATGSIGFLAVELYGRRKIGYSMPQIQSNTSGIAAACRVPPNCRLADPTKLVVWDDYEGGYFGPRNVE